MITRYRAGELSHTQAQLEIEHFWAGALRRAVLDGDVENGSLMAGQSVGMVTEEHSVGAIIDELVEQAAATFRPRDVPQDDPLASAPLMKAASAV